MEMDQGKLFVGGISWDTDENRLKEYFGAYGEVMEAVIMRDRTTGRARGFGFVLFADSAVAERVVKEKHLIDGRTVEAKKAVPRDDQHLITRNNGTIQGSPGHGRTKKIFVGGLASSVTEIDFKTYFDQFGTITDVVVMYDHMTQRPRGFGFISYDSEDSVDRVLHKTFHELNGKMVEVKRAVPKETSPGLIRSPLVSNNNYGFSRTNSVINGHIPGYGFSSLGGFGVRKDGRFSPLSSNRAGFEHLGSFSHGMNMSIDGSSNIGYGRITNPYSGSNQGRYNAPVGYNNGRSDPFVNATFRHSWERSDLDTCLNNFDSSSYFGSESGGFGIFGANWGTSAISSSVNGSSSGYGRENIGFRGAENGYTPSGSGSIYGDPTWKTSSLEPNNPGSFGYGFVNFENDNGKDSDDYGTTYGTTYGITARQSIRGIAA